MATTEIRCELSWSASRAREFQRCKRENWFARYGSWAWWKEQPRGQRYEAMIHKNLTSLPAFAGDCMHRALVRWFELRRAGAQMSSQELFEEARELFRQGWRESNSGDWKRRPNKSVHLEEHHYGAALDKENTDRIRDLLQRCADHFTNLPELAAVRESKPDDWLAVEAMDTYLFMGTKIYAVPDFALSTEDGIHIYDWKTGRPSESDQFQLYTYALYACEKWSADPESIQLHAVYLNAGEIQSFPARIEALSEAQDRMSLSVREMMEIHYDPESDDYIADNWPTNGAPQACPRCRFRGVCEAAGG